MTQLILGLVLFFGIHSFAIVAPRLRESITGSREMAWKALYGVLSLAGLYFMVRGYAEMRLSPVVLYVPPLWLRHVVALLMLPIFVFFLAPYFPGRIKTALKHPQLVAVKLWALGHLLVNGTVADVLLFGTFLVWAVVDRISLGSRPQRPLPGAPASGANDIIVVVIGLALYGVMAFWLHGVAFGVRPFY